MSIRACSTAILKSALASIGEDTHGNRNTLGDRLIKWMELAPTNELFKLQADHSKVFYCAIPKATRAIRADQLLVGMVVHGELGVIDTIEHAGCEPEEPGTAYLYKGDGMIFVSYHLTHSLMRYHYYDMLNVGLKWILEHHRQPKKTFAGRTITTS